jgi:2-polyprenyl-3-methyl-5-hydroxy-6-metoxy-1,4-benzoquinol methylase
MKSKELLQEDEYSIPYHHTINRNSPEGISYFSVIEIIKKIVKEINPKSLLDFGCGDGKLLYELKNLNTSLNGIDMSTKAINFAKIFSPKVNFISGNITNYNFKQKFDMITSVEVLEHIAPENLKELIEINHSLIKKKDIL